MKKQTTSKAVTTKAVVAHVKANAPKGKTSASKLVKHIESKLKQVSPRFEII